MQWVDVLGTAVGSTFRDIYGAIRANGEIQIKFIPAREGAAGRIIAPDLLPSGVVGANNRIYVIGKAIRV